MKLVEWWRIRPFFDKAFYLQRYPDVRQAGMGAAAHYLRHGAAEGRKPNRLFEPDYYASCCPEARKSASPLLHFIATGGLFGNPHPLFDCDAYLAANPDVRKRGINPLLHYITGSRKGSGAPRGSRPTFMILDVEVDAEFWEDAEGRLSFIAEPQQRPYFRAMRFDQLAAQLKP
jgi:hypothetical protein